jgi:uncharacterized protein
MELGIRGTLLLVAGAVSLGVGALGIVVPVLPTVPFLLLSAFCFGRSSPKAQRWLLGNRVFGRYLRGYLRNEGVPWKVRVVALGLLWATICLSEVLAHLPLFARIILPVIGMGVTIHLVTLWPRIGRRQSAR